MLTSLLIDLVALPVPTVGVLRFVWKYFGRTVIITPLNGEVVQLHWVRVNKAVHEKAEVRGVRVSVNKDFLR